MKTKDAYVTFIELVNRNATNNNLNVDIPRFVLLFNRISVEYVAWILDHRNEDIIRTISPLLVLEKPLKLKDKTSTYSSFSLPKDYLELTNLSVTANSGKCLNKKIKAFEVKGEDIEELLDDDSNAPSFEYRETFYLTTSKSVSIYKNDFEINEAKLSYYRYPQKVDIAGYIRPDGSHSTVDIDPELDDKVNYQILTAMAKHFSATNGDYYGFQIQKDQLFSKI